LWGRLATHVTRPRRLKLNRHFLYGSDFANRDIRPTFPSSMSTRTLEPPQFSLSRRQSACRLASCQVARLSSYLVGSVSSPDLRLVRGNFRADGNAFAVFHERWPGAEQRAKARSHSLRTSSSRNWRVQGEKLGVFPFSSWLNHSMRAPAGEKDKVRTWNSSPLAALGKGWASSAKAAFRFTLAGSVSVT
jgi:hypothetical protein